MKHHVVLETNEIYFNTNKTVQDFKESFELFFKESYYQRRNNYIENLKEASKFEGFVAYLFKSVFDVTINFFKDERQLTAENDFNLEIKYDKKMRKTRNIYFEVAEKQKDARQFTKSGILKGADANYKTNKENKYFLIGDEYEFFTFDTQTLIDLYLKSKKKNIQGIRHFENATSKGMIVSIDYIVKNKINRKRYIKENS